MRTEALLLSPLVAVVRLWSGCVSARAVFVFVCVCCDWRGPGRRLKKGAEGPRTRAAPRRAARASADAGAPSKLSV